MFSRLLIGKGEGRERRPLFASIFPPSFFTVSLSVSANGERELNSSRSRLLFLFLLLLLQSNLPLARERCMMVHLGAKDLVPFNSNFDTIGSANTFACNCSWVVAGKNSY